MNSNVSQVIDGAGPITGLFVLLLGGGACLRGCGARGNCLRGQFPEHLDFVGKGDLLRSGSSKRTG